MTAGAAYASDKIGFGSSTITAVTALANQVVTLANAAGNNIALESDLG